MTPRRTRMNRFKEAILFLLVSLLTCLAVFQDALWGKSIAAPVDLAPSLWKHYRHVDPEHGPIPQNHYIVDQLGYDLPLQHLMYHAWRRGEIPWWNPYTLGGRPLLADAHCNGTDPVRLAVYFTIPDFVLAYNWTLILHCAGSGLGLFALLRSFGARLWVAGLCALAGQWAGGYVLYIGHPWVRASFLYYPWLWMAWHRAFLVGRMPVSAPLLMAAILYAGNLQSHAYLPVFALAICAGYSEGDRRKWWRFAKGAIQTAVLGALIAAPVLIPQLELYLQSTRVMGDGRSWHWMETGALLAGIHPWAAGTFRTISLKGVSAGASFHLAVGGAALVLAAFGWAKRRSSPQTCSICAVCGWLVFSYFLIVFSPLHAYLYLRAAGLAVLGLIVLAGLGAEKVLQSTHSEDRWSRGTWLLAAVIATSTTILAQWVYPIFEMKVLDMMLTHAGSDGYGGASLELRKFQVSNFTNEVSLKNPECALNVAGIGFLALALAGDRRGRTLRVSLALVASSVPLLIFAGRFIPRSSIFQWERLLEAGPDQQTIMRQFGSSGARLLEREAEYTQIFPKETATLHRLHVTHGYAAVQPARAAALGIDSADYRLSLADEMLATGNPRFSWRRGTNRPITVAGESLNRLRLAYPPGPENILAVTGTWYPGWTANHTPILPPAGKAIFGEIPVSDGQTETVCEYRPTAFRWSLFCSSVGLAVALGLEWRAKRRMTADPKDKPKSNASAPRIA